MNSDHRSRKSCHCTKTRTVTSVESFFALLRSLFIVTSSVRMGQKPPTSPRLAVPCPNPFNLPRGTKTQLVALLVFCSDPRTRLSQENDSPELRPLANASLLRPKPQAKVTILASFIARLSPWKERLKRPFGPTESRIMIIPGTQMTWSVNGACASCSCAPASGQSEGKQHVERWYYTSRSNPCVGGWLTRIDGCTSVSDDSMSSRLTKTVVFRSSNLPLSLIEVKRKEDWNVAGLILPSSNSRLSWKVQERLSGSPGVGSERSSGLDASTEIVD